jgi:hypothetical protein
MRLNQCGDIGEAIEKTLPVVNELLPGTGPIGAYCLGTICALAWQDRMEPPRSLLEMAVKCPSIEQAAELYREYHLLRESS